MSSVSIACSGLVVAKPRTSATAAGEAQHQVERVDPLGQEHAAAVAGQAAAAGLVVIGLRPPQPDDRRAAGDVAEIAGGQHLGERLGGRAKPVLQDDAERHPGRPRRPRPSAWRARWDLQRLFQEHVLAGRRAAPATMSRCVLGGVRTMTASTLGIIEDRLEAIAGRKGNCAGEGFAARRRRAEGVGDLDPVGEVDEAAGMGAHHHAEPDDRDASFCHRRVLPSPPRSSCRF